MEGLEVVAMPLEARSSRRATVGDRVEAAIAFPCHGVTVRPGDQGVIIRFGTDGSPVVYWSNGLIGSTVWGAVQLW